MHLFSTHRLERKTTAATAPIKFFNGLFTRTAWVSQYQKGKICLDLNEARVVGIDGVLECNGISWTICKQSAPRCRQRLMAMADVDGSCQSLTDSQSQPKLVGLV